ncbi:hypothetical protein KM917_11300 [Virgibacillus pantothenticus]|uniref:hypothetical protein n=1 Tax=Virgibacillus TaxID=84406 RepID=UPI0009542900|nr:MULTISPECIES: hypothetical protein [Virgibacillus]MBS7429268.1 hypothetical protein [Virgibacillus sp. 19R1-5]MBU8642925.1 hypothetical protein [Virgibacillus pantothenticus]MBU8647054.1 hypothetical protein [Virgibacillus pantothenticus]MBU8660777.1 hypothetical protein [Virgibacillus pantothenticus]MBU8669107.1 hypothetical protein [Virgibacillus pantothenticus]
MTNGVVRVLLNKEVLYISMETWRAIDYIYAIIISYKVQIRILEGIMLSAWNEPYF